MRVSIPHDKVSMFCERWKVSELSLFGSVLRDDFGPDSDIDILVTFDDDATPTLFDLVHMKNELKELFGRNVDLVSRRGLESSRNHLRRDTILKFAEAVYADEVPLSPHR